MVSLGVLYTFLCFINPLDSFYMVVGIISTNGYTDILPQESYVIFFTSGFIILSITIFNLFLISAQVHVKAFLDGLFKKYNLYSIDGSTKLEAKNGNKEH
uniref:Potassium channel domain-containing protein n=1 Tax=Lepeophtheirus salmonis TaxID=72036 RepID=A0A0K2UUF3_LEPSM